jgi:lysophospholipase L1-like esterase
MRVRKILQEDIVMKKCGLGFVDLCIILVLIILFTYVEVGFFFVDPYATGAQSSRFLVLAFVWLVRFGVVGLGVLSILLYVNIRLGKINLASLGIVVVVIIILMLIIYPLASYMYSRELTAKIDQFHPYLQLMPQEHLVDKMEKQFKVFCLGGSTTEFVDSTGLGWPERAQELLKTKYNKQMKIYNFGRQWYTTQHTLINYNANLRSYRPNVIMTMDGINDLLQNADFSYFSTGTFREDYGHFWGPMRRLVSQPTLASAAVQSLRLFWYCPKRQVIDTESFPGLAAYRRNLKTIIDMARVDGTEVILLTQAFLMKDDMNERERAALTMVNREAIGARKKWSAKTAKSGMEQYNQAVIEIAKRENLRLLDLEKVIPKTLEYLRDDVHYTDKAFVIISEYVAEMLNSTSLP